MYTMYADTSNNTLFYTHISSYVVWKVHPHTSSVQKIKLFEFMRVRSSTRTPK